MATTRPESMIIPPGVFDETNISNKKSVPMYGHSSSSSIDSASGTNVNNNDQNSSAQNGLTATTSSTTTDSDFESEQDDNLLSRRQKSDSSTSDQLPRRTKHFYKLFKSEIPNEMPEIIDSYVCAYQGDILLQGKMYITDRYLCFHSRIINYVTKHVYRWEQIESVTKERVAFIFPTAIGIQLKQSGKKITYASFLLRDQAYDKIVSIGSQFSSEIHSFDDDNNDSANGGTLKAPKPNEKRKSYHRESYDIIDGPENEVLQLCLKNNSRGISPNPRKTSEEKQSTRKFEKKSLTKSLNQDQKLSSENNNSNPTTRNSRYTKNEQKLSDKTKRNSSLVNHRSQSRHRDRTIPRTNETISQSNSLLPPSSPPSSPPIQSSMSNSNSKGILNIIFSFLNQIYQYFSSLFPSHPMKATIIIFLVLTILFLHSFYLIKLAFRIENRLQSLHHLWPSASSMKNSFSSNTKDL